MSPFATPAVVEKNEQQKTSCEKSRIMCSVTRKMSEWTSRTLTIFYFEINTINQEKMLACKCKDAHATSFTSSLCKENILFFAALFIFIAHICTSLHHTKASLSADEMRKMQRKKNKSDASGKRRMTRVNVGKKKSASSYSTGCACPDLYIKIKSFVTDN